MLLCGLTLAGEKAASHVLEALSVFLAPVCTCVTTLLLWPPAYLGL